MVHQMYIKTGIHEVLKSVETAKTMYLYVLLWKQECAIHCPGTSQNDRSFTGYYGGNDDIHIALRRFIGFMSDLQ